MRDILDDMRRAAEDCDAQQMRTLLEKYPRFNINSTDFYFGFPRLQGHSMLIIAAQHPSIYGQPPKDLPKIITMLLERNANVNQATSGDRMTALTVLINHVSISHRSKFKEDYYPIHLEAIKILLEHGAAVNLSSCSVSKLC
jgi:hypothetical protein